jgi:hypothetical protein
MGEDGFVLLKYVLYFSHFLILAADLRRQVKNSKYEVFFPTSALFIET